MDVSFQFSYHGILNADLFLRGLDMEFEKIFNLKNPKDGAINRRKFPGPNSPYIALGHLRCRVFAHLRVFFGEQFIYELVFLIEKAN